MTEQQQVPVTNHVVTSTQINEFIQILDSLSKREGLTLQGADMLIRGVVQPLTALPQVNITPEEPTNE